MQFSGNISCHDISALIFQITIAFVKLRKSRKLLHFKLLWTSKCPKIGSLVHCVLESFGFMGLKFGQWVALHNKDSFHSCFWWFCVGVSGILCSTVRLEWLPDVKILGPKEYNVDQQANELLGSYPFLVLSIWLVLNCILKILKVAIIAMDHSVGFSTILSPFGLKLDFGCFSYRSLVFFASP